jgi:transposase
MSEELEDTHLLSDKIKWGIIAFKKQGMKDLDVAKEARSLYNRPTLHHKTVKLIWERYLESGSVDNKWNPEGRPKVLSEMEEEKILDYSRENRRNSAQQCKEDLELQASRESINRCLLNNGQRSYKAPTQIKIRPRNLTKRLLFAEKYRNWAINDWQSIVYSDESRFSLVMPNWRI